MRLPLVVIVVALSLVGAACGPFGAPTSSGPPPITGTRIGFSPGGGLLWENDADLARDLDNAASTGAKWIRLDLNWTGIQASGPTQWSWSYADRAVAAIQSRGLQIMVTLDYTPTWARQASCSSSMFCPPADPNAYASFARGVAARYGPQGVHAYEVWNEPNWAPWWIGAPNASAYVSLLKAAYPAIHDADPAATVVTGGLAPHGDLGANPTDPINPTNYLKAMYAAGAHGSFDAFGVHPYPPLPYGPTTGSPNWNTMLQTSMMHDVMVANGDGAKQIWGTEFGAPTGSTSSMAVSESTQAQYFTGGYQYWSGLSFTGPLFVDTLRDWTPTGSDDWGAHMGVTHQDFSPKPAVGALKALTNG